jgi:hypothetical protein
VKVCPYCAEKIQDEAAKCRLCGEWLDPNSRPAWSLDFAMIGEQLGRQLVEAAERGQIGQDAARALTAALKKVTGVEPGESPPSMGVAAPQSNLPASEAPNSEGSGGVNAWSPPNWLAQSAATADTAVSSTAPPPAEPAAANQPSQVDTLNSEADAPAPQAPATTAATSPEVSGSIETDRASLEDVAARMQRLKATADAVQRSLAEKAAERSGSAGLVEESSAAAPGQPAIERGKTLIQGTAPATPDPAAGQRGSGPRRRGGTMDRLERSILGDEKDDFGDLDSEGSGFGSTSFGEAVSARRPLPWMPLLAGAAAVAAIGWYFFEGPGARTDPTTDPVAAATGPEATGQATTEAAVDPPAEDEGEEPVADDGNDEPAGETGEAAAEGGGEEPAEDDGAAAEGGTPPADDGGGGEPPPANEAFDEKLAEAQKLYKRSKLSPARAALDEALGISPNHPAALVLLAQVQLEQNELGPALQTATKCVGIDATKADCWLTIAALEEANKAHANALTAWQKYLEHDPKGRYASNAKKAIKRLERQVAG